MTKRILTCMFSILLLLTGCAKQSAELPDPAELYIEIADTVALPEMVELPTELFSDYYGIETDWFDSAVSYQCQDIMRPDEIVIIKAVSQDAANDVKAKLESWLKYKEKSAENYFADTILSIQNGVIRQDGLTVSLLVSADIDEVVKVYGMN